PTISIAALGETDSAGAAADLRRIMTGRGGSATFVVVPAQGPFVARSDVTGVKGSTAELAGQAVAAHPGHLADALSEFVTLVDAAAGASPIGPSRDGGLRATTLVPVLLVSLIGFWLVRLLRGHRHWVWVVAAAAG